MYRVSVAVADVAVFSVWIKTVTDGTGYFVIRCSVPCSKCRDLVILSDRGEPSARWPSRRQKQLQCFNAPAKGGTSTSGANNEHVVSASKWRYLSDFW